MHTTVSILVLVSSSCTLIFWNMTVVWTSTELYCLSSPQWSLDAEKNVSFSDNVQAGIHGLKVGILSLKDLTITNKDLTITKKPR